MENLTEAVREAKRQYMREWRKKNPERVKANNRRYWERKANGRNGNESRNESGYGGEDGRYDGDRSAVCF